jgi:hypothetical protein
LLKALPLLLLGKWGKQRMWRMVFGPSPAQSSPIAPSIQELMEIISNAVKPRIVSIPRLSDEQLRQIEAPMLVAMGGRDVLIDSFDTRQRLAHLAPHADVRFYENGYHYLPAQAPIIFEFLLRELPEGSQHGQVS